MTPMCARADALPTDWWYPTDWVLKDGGDWMEGQEAERRRRGSIEEESSDEKRSREVGGDAKVRE